MYTPEFNKTSRQLAHTAITRIESDNAYTDIVLTNLLGKSELDSREKAFVSELVRGVVRWKKRLDHIVNKLLTGKRNKLPDAIRYNLWLALYQIMFTNVPPHAAVNEAVKLSRDLKLHGFSGLVNGVLRNYLRNPEQIQYADKTVNATQFLAMYYSHPEWMVKSWIDQFGVETAEALCRHNNQPPVLCMRMNQQKISSVDFEKLLIENNAEFTPGLPNFYRLQSIDFQFSNYLLANALATFQDESAGLPGLLLDPHPQEIIADICAAPGGKSMHMAELAHDQATIIGADINLARCRLVKQAGERLQHHVQVVTADALHFPVKQVDKILVDAPCSGLGVLAKKPDIRWQRTQKEMRQLTKLQTKILQQAASLVKRGGSLVYSTCTIDTRENENIIKSFLEFNTDFYIADIANSQLQPFVTKDGFIRTWPHLHHMDGSFCAKLERK